VQKLKAKIAGKLGTFSPVTLLAVLIIAAFLAGVAVVPIWQTEVIDNTGGGLYEPMSIVLDASGMPHISYYDTVNASLKYAYKDIDGWHAEIIEYTGQAYRPTAIVLDASGMPHISYYGTANSSLKYAYKDSWGWHIESVESMAGKYQPSSLIVDDSGMPHISYYDTNSSKLYYAYKDKDGWHKELIDSVNETYNPVIVLDSAGSPFISYYDITSGDLKYAYRDILKVSATEPVNGELNIAVDSAITVIFEELVRASKSYESIALKDADGNVVPINKSIEGDTLVIETVDYLEHSKKYTVFIPVGAVESIAGISLHKPHSISFTTKAETTGFKDAPSNAWYVPYLDKLVNKGAIAGHSDGTFRPDKGVTRAEFAKMLVLARGWSLKEFQRDSFIDVTADHWAYRYIQTAEVNNAMVGYKDGTFRPDKNITRAEIARVVAGSLYLSPGGNLLKDIDSCWAKDYINACVQAGIVNGYPDNTFRPDNTATRAEAAKMISGMLKDGFN